MTITNVTPANRPFEKIAYSTLVAVVKRGKYTRYGVEFEAALQYELQVRNLRVS